MDTQLTAHLSGVFSPGVPDTFHSNYLAAMAFLGSLESQCQTQASVTAFRECAACATFTKRWNLSVYYSLRFQEVAGKLEGVLGGANTVEVVSAEDAAASQAVPLRCVATHTTLCALQRASARDVVLRPLADKFVRLSLQCVMRCVLRGMVFGCTSLVHVEACTRRARSIFALCLRAICRVAHVCLSSGVLGG